MVMLSDFKDDELEFDDSSSKEINEAIVAGEKALESLNAARNKLSSASSWGLFDMLGGGTLTSLIKHSNMRDGKYYMEKARDDLKAFSKELNDISIDLDADIETDDFLSFADIFFDNFFVDMFMQNRISDAKQKIDETIYKVERILDRIR